MVTGVVPSPPRYVISLLSHIGFSIPTARRLSSNVANSRSRAFCRSIFMQEKVPTYESVNSVRIEPTKLFLVGTRITYQATTPACMMMSQALCEQSRRPFPFLHKVLSRKRAISSSRGGPPFGVLFARRGSACSPLPTLLGAASAVLASSPGEACCFRFFFKIIVPISSVFSLFVYIIYISV